MSEAATAAPEREANTGEEIVPEGREDGGLDGELVPHHKGSILNAARFDFDSAQIEAIRRTVAKDCSDAELVMFLELCARYELDPFAKQIFAAKMGGQVQIIVSRDGLLAHADRKADFLGMTGDVVRADDTFEVEWTDGEIAKLRHAYNGFKDRGEIVGAWAMVKRKGRGKTYFFAPFSEYKGKNVWDKNPSAMILKVPESYALRKAYSISGIVGEEEVTASRSVQNLSELPDEPDWGDDEVLAERLQNLFDKANETKPSSYRPQKVKTMLEGVDKEVREKIAKDLESFIENNEAPAERIEEAQVVEEKGAAS